MVGPEAILPVMEGKSVIFKTFAGVDALPICLSTHDISEIVETVIELAPTFGGICLEDIVAPACLTIGEELQRAMNIPVVNNHREAVAVGVLAGVLNALKIVGKGQRFPPTSRWSSTAAVPPGSARPRSLLKIGVRNIVVCDRHGALSPYRPQTMHWAKWEWRRRPIPTRARRSGDGHSRRRPLHRIFGGRRRHRRHGPQHGEGPGHLCLCGGRCPKSNPLPRVPPAPRVVATAQSQYPNQMDIASVFPGLFAVSSTCARAK